MTPSRQPQGVGGGVTDLLQDIGQIGVQRVTFRSQLTPTISVDPFAPSTPSEKPSLAMRLVKPAVTIDTIGGPVVFAPYGEPTANYSVVWLVLIGLLGLGAYTAVAYTARHSPWKPWKLLKGS